MRRILSTYSRQSSTKVDTYQALNTMSLHCMDTLHQARAFLA